MGRWVRSKNKEGAKWEVRGRGGEREREWVGENA